MRAHGARTQLAVAEILLTTLRARGLDGRLLVQCGGRTVAIDMAGRPIDHEAMLDWLMGMVRELEAGEGRPGRSDRLEGWRP